MVILKKCQQTEKFVWGSKIGHDENWGESIFVRNYLACPFMDCPLQGILANCHDYPVSLQFPIVASFRIQLVKQNNINAKIHGLYLKLVALACFICQ